MKSKNGQVLQRLYSFNKNLESNDNLENEQLGDNVTVYSNLENSILVDCPVNFKNIKLLFSKVNFSPAQPTIINLFENKQRILL